MARYSKTDLNPLQEKFVLAYLECGNQGEAYIKAGYKVKDKANASANANTLLKNPKIWQAIRRLQDDMADTLLISKSWVLKQLIQNVQRASQAEEVLDREGVPTGEYVYQGNVVNKALELIGKEIGMFRDKVDVTHEGSIQHDHNLRIHKIDELKLPLEVRKLLLEKIQERHKQIELNPIEPQEFPTAPEVIPPPNGHVQEAAQCQSPPTTIQASTPKNSD